MADFISIKHNIPKSIISEQDIKAAVDKATKAGADRVVRILAKTVSTWEEPPTFSVRKGPEGYEVHYDARTRGGKHFEWVSGGVKAHTITSRGPKPMTFQWAGKGNYPAKSHVGSLNPYKGMSAKKGLPGMAYVRLYQIQHPGIWPRDFAGIIMRDQKDKILREIVSLVSQLPKHGMYGPRLEQ